MSMPNGPRCSRSFGPAESHSHCPRRGGAVEDEAGEGDAVAGGKRALAGTRAVARVRAARRVPDLANGLQLVCGIPTNPR
jgi:hypothetical protein